MRSGRMPWLCCAVLACKAAAHPAATTTAPAPVRDPAGDELQQLDQYGDVPPCVATYRAMSEQERKAREQRKKDCIARWGTCVDAPVMPVMQPVPPLARLAGRTNELLPYLESPSIAVVRRAVDVLCSIQDDEARDAIANLAARQPCLEFLQKALQGAGADESRPSAARALAAIHDAASDDGCVHAGGVITCEPYTRSRCSREYTDSQDVMPGSPVARRYAGLVASTGGPASFRALLRAARQMCGSLGHWYRFRESFARGDAPVALARAAKRTGLTEGAILRDVSRGMSSTELDDLQSIAEAIPRQLGTGFAELTALAPREAARHDLPAAERAFWHGLANDGEDPDPALCRGLWNGGAVEPIYYDACNRAYEKTAKGLEASLKRRDQHALRLYLSDESNELGLRMLAATSLLQLGDDTGFPLLEELPASSNITPTLRRAALAELNGIRGKVPSPLTGRLEALIAATTRRSAPDELARKRMIDATSALPRPATP